MHRRTHTHMHTRTHTHAHTHTHTFTHTHTHTQTHMHTQAHTHTHTHTCTHAHTHTHTHTHTHAHTHTHTCTHAHTAQTHALDVMRTDMPPSQDHNTSLLYMPYLHTLYYIAMYVLPLLLHSFTQYYFLVQSTLMNLLNGWYWSFLSTVTLHPTHLATPHIHYCTLHLPHAVSLSLFCYLHKSGLAVVISSVSTSFWMARLEIATFRYQPLTSTHSPPCTFYPRTKYVATFAVHPHLSPTPLIQHPSLPHASSPHIDSPQQNMYALKEDPELKVELYTRLLERYQLLGLDR